MKYILHKKVTFRIGGRNIAKISREEFVKKAKDFCMTHTYKSNWATENKLFDDVITVICNLGRLIDASSNYIKRDFKGICYDASASHRVGTLQISPSGYPYLCGCIGGGNWGKELLIIVYYDGKKLRVYVPTCGNLWRLDTKEVLNEDLDENSSKGLGDKEYVIKDLIKTGQLPQGTSPDEPGIDVEFDLKSGIAEFYSRIMEA